MLRDTIARTRSVVAGDLVEKYRRARFRKRAGLLDRECLPGGEIVNFSGTWVADYQEVRSRATDTSYMRIV